MKRLKIDYLFKKQLLIIIPLLILLIIRVSFTQTNKSRLNDTKFSGVITQIQKDDNKLILIVKNKTKIKVTYYHNLEVELGDTIALEGHFKVPSQVPVFNTFKYNNYLKSLGITYLFQADKINKVATNKNILYVLKNKIIKHINIFTRSDYLKTFIIGDTSLINKTSKSMYQTLGISHLFAVSGMHVSLLSGVLLFLLKKVVNNKLAHNLLAIFLLFYMFLTNFSPSIVRTVFLTIVFFYDLNCSKRFVLIILFLSFLIYNPYYIYHNGFLFSFTISFYLLSFNQLINKQTNYLTKLLTTSLIAFIASFPITIYNYFEINILTIINNLIFVPYVSLILFPITLLTFFLPFLNSLLNWIVLIFENLLNICQIFNLTIPFVRHNIFLYIFYSLIIYYALKKCMINNYKPLITFILLLSLHFISPYFYTQTMVTMLDVGQGDSTLIRLKHNACSILIDTGGIPNYYRQTEPFLVKTRTIPYLKSIGVRKLDYLILTHGDFDHIGEVLSLLENFKVKHVLLNMGNNNKLEIEIIKYMQINKINYEQVGTKSFSQASMNFLIINNKNLEENEDSLIFYTKLEGRHILLMGDAPTTLEKYILDTYNLPRMDILKLGHHGSKTSSSEVFLKSLKPKISLISVGIDNKYHHPSRIVIDRLNKYKLNRYLTSIDGSVSIYLRKLKVKTYNS